MRPLAMAYGPPADDDDYPGPATFDVRLTLQELALIYRYAGHVPHLAVTRAGGDQAWGEANADLAEGASHLLNTFFDSGIDDVAPRFGAVEIAEVSGDSVLVRHPVAYRVPAPHVHEHVWRTDLDDPVNHGDYVCECGDVMPASVWR